MKRVKNHLSDEQRHVLFDKGTEAPFSGALLHEERDGHFRCANCGHPLFSSRHKYDSGSGWPSFTCPMEDTSVRTAADTSLGMERTEVTCQNCGGHLGHVFDDGPREPGGQRYCINSLSLDFQPRDKKD